MNNIAILNALLIDRLIEDLSDPRKCTPGLYQAVRGIITDNRDKLDDIPESLVQELETKMLSKAPFKLR